MLSMQLRYVRVHHTVGCIFTLHTQSLGLHMYMPFLSSPMTPYRHDSRSYMSNSVCELFQDTPATPNIFNRLPISFSTQTQHVTILVLAGTMRSSFTPPRLALATLS